MHILFKLVVYLLLGAIINIAVACGCALTLNRNWNIAPLVITNELTPRQVQWWVDHAPCDFPPVPQMSATYSGESFRGIGIGIGIDETQMWTPRSDSSNWRGYNLLHIRAGWPFRALEGTRWQVYGSGDKDRDIYRAVLPILKGSRWLLLRPRWFGFIANTLIYAFLLYGLFYGPRISKRFIREKKGHCIKCGYDLRGTSGSGCSECGWKRDEVKA